jgi:hypothetical protein
MSRGEVELHGRNEASREEDRRQEHESCYMLQGGYGLPRSFPKGSSGVRRTGVRSFIRAGEGREMSKFAERGRTACGRATPCGSRGLGWGRVMLPALRLGRPGGRPAWGHGRSEGYGNGT